MVTPQAAINCRRNISGPLQILPSLSSLALSSETNRSSSELVDLAAAHSESITRTRRTTRSESIKTTRVLAAPGSSGTIILILPWNNDPKIFQKSNISISFKGACEQSAPDNFTKLVMSKNYEEQFHQSLPAQASYWFKLPTPNRTYLDFLFETDEEKAVKEFEKFVDIIEKKKVKEKETKDA